VTFENYQPDEFSQQQELDRWPEPRPGRVQIFRSEGDHDRTDGNRAGGDRDDPVAPLRLL
jgi:hypothetical protein